MHYDQNGFYINCCKTCKQVCQVYGPDKTGDSADWVVNRGFVTQTGDANLLMRDNIFHIFFHPGRKTAGIILWTDLQCKKMCSKIDTSRISFRIERKSGFRR